MAVTRMQGVRVTRTASISGYEKNLREPPLMVLLRYARIAGVTMETLVDDRMKLRKQRCTRFDPFGRSVVP